MITVRIKFNKTGLSSYYSQLDLQRVMARALKKSGLPVWYSQGFNPHIYMTFTLPLSLGHESFCESMDFRLTEELSGEKIVSALQDTLPAGIEVTWAGAPDYDARRIMWAKYEISILALENTIKQSLEKYDAAEKAIVIKSTKKGSKEIDLKELIKNIEYLDNGKVAAIFPAGVALNINPSLFLEYLQENFGIKTSDAYITRTQLFDENMGILQ